MVDAFVQEFLRSFDDSHYPDDFLATYEAIECFAHNEAGETLLVKDRQSGHYYVAKCYTDKALLSHTTENELLKNLHHPGLPAFIGEYHNDEMLCVVREYLEGITLDQYAVENRLSEERILSIAKQLCDILTYLHSQKPPVIHRDIKPQNLIIDTHGTLRLIDFGISRVFDEAAREDTIFFGTKNFAPPEQYGFSQTDSRADIFSTGILLCWLLTGESDTKTALSKITNARLRRIIKKCTCFSPEKRYSSAVKLKYALINVDGHRLKMALRWGYSCLACILFLCIGFYLGRYTEFSPAVSVSSGVTFREPLIEQAVRLMLQKQNDEPITENNLTNVTELYIFGDQVVRNCDEYIAVGSHMAKSDGMVKKGNLTTLEDLKKLKNLKILNIALENISDLTPLSNIHTLEQIDLKHNPVEDVSPLASMNSLRELYLFETRVSDLSALSGCPMLKNIDVGKTYVTSFSAFKGINNLKNLSLKQAPIKNLIGIEKFSQLEQISLSNVADGNLSSLMKLPQLRDVDLDEDLRPAAQKDLQEAKFSITYS
ncbi:protein kinase domain-containing protein [Acetanaerobacterium elongatum]|uniref:non-specific serine/threonine protein kinase n=1 Tax=Acetanaerobacterium elongatum TaxID=258515 RepID=A0A1H0EZN0_9FIRM|nr:protein kinase [Acetanaerobacterium elongatum]SDN87795.1 Serine/threonine protein kinase [Acetanaerobacterium elongatum]